MKAELLLLEKKIYNLVNAQTRKMITNPTIR